ncbi:3-deoxy-8-phosphooctulonate synthase [Magnetococcales bacterium HHB-1]
MTQKSKAEHQIPENRTVEITQPGKSTLLKISQKKPLVILAGPCVIESESFALKTAEALKTISQQVDIKIIYKSSFDKANRSSLSGFRGPGMDEGLKILEKVRTQIGLPVVTDLHTAEQAIPVSQVADLLQTPAFLCRQTDLIQAAAKTGKPVNIKKGQFLAPEGMKGVVQKAQDVGNNNILLCERGYAFGYNNLVVDMRSLVIMAKTGCPVVFDATHSVQLPGGLGESSGGDRRFVAPLARAAVAVGVGALFLETHPDPDQAPCDGPNMVPLDQLASLLTQLKTLDQVAKDHG